MNKPLIEIAYDDREHAEILLKQLTLHTDVHLIRKRLKLGDYQINNWLIERKTLPDLALSLCNGRLFSQIYRLSKSSSNTALITDFFANGSLKRNIFSIESFLLYLVI
ncbi:ERCC4 domain-containing protein [Shewanella psychrophila]|uniref:ERCC4 domain-containing protein n=1 Tax=Shewanella psychrophila TaxID=225848 RepID=UPI000989F136|nr:ERCC4 domain-containing protein [Shewanella psychrophila]